MEEKISIVIITYKRSVKILQRAIDSALGQSYSNKEVIVINDAPDYEQRGEIDSLISDYGHRVRYIVNEKNLGGNAARNKGIAVSEGEYIAFLDDDDSFMPDKLKRSIEYFDQGVGIVYSDMLLSVGTRRPRVVRRSDVAEQSQLTEILSGNYVGGYSSIMIRKNVLVQCGGLDESLQSYQDLDLLIRLAQRCKFRHVSLPLITYYVSNDAISTNPEKKIEGLYTLINKHEILYERYSRSKVRNINSEIVNFCKCGWFCPAYKLYRNMYSRGQRVRYSYIFVLGIAKYLAVKIL